MVPIRDQITKKLIAQFRSVMNDGALPLVVLEEHTLTGQDDWGEDDESQSVDCWWAVFGKQSPQEKGRNVPSLGRSLRQ
jgi:hypothetical protein